MSSEFYAVLSELFDQIAQAPLVIPALPINQWPVESPERHLLISLESLVVAWQRQAQAGISQAEQQFQARIEASISEQKDIALINSHIYEEAQIVAVMEERQRLAQNLHDAINQSLFSAGLIAEVLPRLWERSPEEGRKSLEDLRRLTRGALAEMRGLLVELRPVVLTDTELSDLLYQLSNAFTGRTNIPVTVTLEGNGTIPAEVQVALYRTCQEGLSNIAKHARADQVAIELHLQAGGVEMHLHDNGRGFNPSSIPSGHFGLSMMKERAETVGAELKITSDPGHGSTITFSWAEQAESEK
ncbi:MAG: sensor histidine kinase [Chloroflexi bacterium]|nr:sensor histidine kinase [Chloroflexota bacterium]